MICLLCCPSIIVLNSGLQLYSHFFAALTNIIGTRRLQTTAYHPAANRVVKRFHRQLRTSLTARGSRNHWTSYPTYVLLGICSPLEFD